MHNFAYLCIFTQKYIEHIYIVYIYGFIVHNYVFVMHNYSLNICIILQNMHIFAYTSDFKCIMYYYDSSDFLSIVIIPVPVTAHAPVTEVATA